MQQSGFYRRIFAWGMMDSKSTSAEKGRLFDLSGKKAKAILVGTYLSTKAKDQTIDQVNELASLSDTFGLESVFRGLQMQPCQLRWPALLFFDSRPLLKRGFGS